MAAGLAEVPVSEGVIDILLPRFPECWDTCGSCAGDDLQILEVLVAPGDEVARDDHLLLIETRKTLLEIPAPRAGIVIEVLAQVGDVPVEGMPILRMVPFD